jgi:ubiquinone/menaquinone biosynthesis C-methylase UbiE
MVSDHNHLRVNPGLVTKNFQKISQNGFGDPYNAYPHSMIWFQDHLYVGTTRATLAYRGRQRAEDKPDWLGAIWPVKIPKGIWDIDLRAEIWRYHPSTNRWSKVFRSPLVEGSEGDKVPLSVAFRSMAIFQGRSDSAPAIYAPTMSTYQTSAVMLRSCDGVKFKLGRSEGLGFPEPYESRGVRAFVTCNGRLFTSPAIAPKGRRKSYNVPESMVVLVTDDPIRGKWQLACEPHFGHSNNLTVFEMIEFNGYLYAGTMNINEGFQIWKTSAEGKPPFRWKKVLSHGAYRGKLNQGAITFQPFRGCLYLGTGIQEGGYDRYNNVGPAAVELIRIHPDDSWDIIVGEPRLTPDGFKVPLSGLGPGFGKPFAGYLWSMCVHEGWLYAGTYDSLSSIRYGKLDRWLEQLSIMLSRKRLEQIIDKFGGFDLWRSRDGCRWVPVTQNGFGNPFNIGVRTMMSTPHGLFVGAANPFAPEVAVKRIVGWNYENNPRGGLEIWLGSRNPGPAGPSDTIPEASVLLMGSHTITNKAIKNDAKNLEAIISQFYGDSGFRHFGYWSAGVNDAKAACENLMDEMLAFISEKKGYIVDIGCSLGVSTQYLLKYFPPEAVTGITSEKKFLEACRKTSSRMRFLYRKLPKLQLPAESFNFVTWMKGLDVLGARQKLFRESFRILKPGGQLVCFDVLPAIKGASHWTDILRRESAVTSLYEYRDLLIAIGFRDLRLVDVTTETIEGFRKYMTKYFELKKLCGELEDSTFQGVKSYLLPDKKPFHQCLLASGFKA